jgi:hypothetical protein
MRAGPGYLDRGATSTCTFQDQQHGGLGIPYKREDVGSGGMRGAAAALRRGQARPKTSVLGSTSGEMAHATAAPAAAIVPATVAARGAREFLSRISDVYV